jgi:preprotein translocase subunit SecE
MSKEGDSTANAYLRDLFSLEVYKRSQGRLARQITFAVLAFAIALGAWALKNTLTDPNRSQWTVISIAGGVLAIGVWVSFRVVNIPRFADFLIAVEAEMNKVSWPTRTELFRASTVVIVVMFGLATALYAYDVLWQQLVTALGVLRPH